jgi:hypothetical protein
MQQCLVDADELALFVRERGFRPWSSGACSGRRGWRRSSGRWAGWRGDRRGRGRMGTRSCCRRRRRCCRRTSILPGSCLRFRLKSALGPLPDRLIQSAELLLHLDEDSCLETHAEIQRAVAHSVRLYVFRLYFCSTRAAPQYRVDSVDSFLHQKARPKVAHGKCREISLAVVNA